MHESFFLTRLHTKDMKIKPKTMDLPHWLERLLSKEKNKIQAKTKQTNTEHKLPVKHIETNK